ncbi:MAG TPA: hypothetical protein VFP44_02535 [Usitatibacter sp.]|nr:hypothetical protein [Usitatibacter sp.]
MRTIAAVAAIALAAMAAACSKPQQPKVEITKPLDTAKGMQDDLNKKAQDNLDKADQLSK